MTKERVVGETEAQEVKKKPWKTREKRLFGALRKTCCECGKTLAEGAKEVSDLCFGENAPKTSRKIPKAKRMIGKTLCDVGSSFRKNFKGVTFKNALMEVSHELGQLARATKKGGKRFLDELFS